MRIWKHLAEISANLIRFGQIKILHPQKHLISYDYELNGMM